MSDTLMTTREVADFLRLNTQTVRHMADRGELPVVIVRRSPARRTIRFRREDIEQWVAEHTRNPR